ncbi:MAG: hypothetical protein KGL75_11290, partial [Acidobacteriota bacterium]|nr:hypothetical protein [Acidobacteriota bacterium]
SYRVLADEGWLDLARHRGATVRDRPESKPGAGAIQAFARRVQESAAEAIAGGLSRGTAAQQLIAIARQLSKG